MFVRFVGARDGELGGRIWRGGGASWRFGWDGFLEGSKWRSLLKARVLEPIRNCDFQERLRDMHGDPTIVGIEAIRPLNLSVAFYSVLRTPGGAGCLPSTVHSSLLRFDTGTLTLGLYTPSAEGSAGLGNTSVAA